MSGVFRSERMKELDEVLGTDRRNALLASLSTQAADAQLAFRRHLAIADRRQLMRDVHRLKGAAEIVGADGLIAALRDVENRPPEEVNDDLLAVVDARIAELIAAAAAYPR